MKHGDKAKATASKTSGKKASKAGGAGHKDAKNLKASKQSVSAKGPDVKKTSAATKTSGGNGSPKGRAPEGGIHFTNPAVGAAFNRALKKFPNAFKRLTD